ncbi:hypothetical protein yc1106_09534 [Curvularia clavata]|uniref:Uncharacterized protein n=1 Tax=Curvularia clavata TaxID=95742 RepID=A0A9Q8ZHF6_CURCL|nr:hypothetical protein yc1106_09534 [Curvularia clavata]
MSQQQEEKRDFVFVRHRRTKQIDIRLANQLSPRLNVDPKTHEHALHYISLDREHICRCNNPIRHGEKFLSVASESIHLHTSLALFMARHNVESCTANEFRKYSQGREIEWAKEGVFVKSFHYTSREKDIVCRCKQPEGHSRGTPRNPEIIEQCAEYFCSHKHRRSVSKKEWRRVDGDTPPPYRPGVPGESQTPRKSKTPVFNDSVAERLAKSVPKREMKTRSNAAQLTPPFMTSYKDGAAKQQEPEMPPEVWENARPSLWAQRDGVSSTATTPLGSPSSPCRPSRVPATAPIANHIPGSNRSRPGSASTCWSQVKRDANVDDMRWGMKTAPVGKSSRPGSDPFEYSCHLSTNMRDDRELGDKYEASKAINETDEHVGQCSSADEQPLRESRLDGYLLQPLAYNPNAEKYVYKEVVPNQMTPNGSVTELSAQVFTAELPADTPRRQHTPTLERLEGRDRAAILEMESETKKMMHQPETMSNRMSCLTQNSELFNSLLEQIQSSPVTSIPTLPVVGSSRDYRDYQEHSQVPASQETLADRINAQREAIFNVQMTPLEEEFRIEFPQRSDFVMCTSQEEVSVAQLLLINDHVATHAIEAVQLFETQGIEPDWHADVIQPAIMLFKGWNRPFTDLVSYMHEAFLNLMAWAELLRLMRATQVTVAGTQGGEVMLSWIAELQDGLIEAQELYDMAKQKWRIDIFEPLSCDKIASYVVTRAMGTRTV